MAKIVGPLMSQEAHGLVGARLTFSKKKTGQQVRFQRSNIDLNSFDQKTNRAVYQDAVAEWNLLSTAEKDVWKDQAVGLGLTGFNLFIKDYYMNTIRKLATVENIDLKVVADTLLYTVPTGTKLVVTGFAYRTKTFDSVVEDGTYSLIKTSNNAEIFLVSIPYLLASPSYMSSTSTTEAGIFFETISAGDSIKFRVSVANSGTTFTIDFDLIGYLLEA
jgi:hypothetical protein